MYKRQVYLQEVNPSWGVRAQYNGITIQNLTWYTVKILVTDAGGGSVRIQAKVWKRGEDNWCIYAGYGWICYHRERREVYKNIQAAEER